MKANPKGRVLRGALAAVLACGLMMPTGALAADGQGTETPPPATLTLPDGSEAAPAIGEEDPTTFDTAPSDAKPATGNASDQPESDVEESESSAGDSPADPHGVTSDNGAETADPESPAALLARKVLSTAEKATTQASIAFATTRASTTNPFIVEGGTAGLAPGEGDYYYDSDKGTFHIQTSTPLTLSTAFQVSENIEIDAGVRADLTLDNVDIATPADGTTSPINMVTNVMDTEDKTRAIHADQILHKTMLHITLADGSSNKLACLNRASGGAGSPGIRCGWGSVLVIDDTIRNLDSNNNVITPENGVIGKPVTLANGTYLEAGTPLSALDSKNPGTLTVDAGGNSAAIGSGPEENAGKLIFQGGNVYANGCNQGLSDNYSPDTGAAIGGGEGGSGTITIFNGGRIIATASYHGAAIGSGWGFWKRGDQTTAKPDAIAIPTFSSVPKVGEYDGYTFWNSSVGQFDTVAGDIYINGGYIEAKGAEHGNGFGSACLYTTSSNRNHIIRVTGGTLLPSSTSINKDMGGNNGYVVITGGSVSLTKKADGKPDESKFQGIGDTAFNTEGIATWSNVVDKGGSLPENDKVFMITIDLGSEIEKRNTEAGITNDDKLDDRIHSWRLTVGGKEYNYGAPDRFDNGLLYLWLPKNATEKEISVDLTYTDKNGDIQKIEPLFRDPHTDQNGTTLKRYISFELPDSFKNLWKYYDGTPLPGLSIDPDNKLPTEDGKELSKPDRISYKYQLYSDDRQTALGTESASATEMPSNVGTMKLTVDSTEHAVEGSVFATSYWGHRATGWCEIKPIASKVSLINAEWVADKEPGDKHHNSDLELSLHARIDRGDTQPDGAPTKATCKAPEGFIQLYMDGKKVGDPIEIVFPASPIARALAISSDGGDAEPTPNATRVDNGQGGSYTDFIYTFKPSDADFLVPDATTDGKHIVSVQYLPSNAEEVADLKSEAPANYFKSVNPAEDPEAAPKAEVAIDPIDPEPSVTIPVDPGADPDKSKPSIDTDYDHPTADKPGADPSKPGDKTYRGEMTLIYEKPDPDATENPGAVDLKIETPSSGPITVTTADGTVLEAKIITDENGTPVRDENGRITVRVNPTSVGKTELTIKQEPNGAYTGTTFIYGVTVKADPQIAPKPSLAKKAENLTHPNGPTQPGDRIRYTVTAGNDATGSVWTQVMIEDPLPACLQIDEDTLRLTNERDGLKDAPLAKATSVASSDVGEFSLAARGGKQVLSVPAGAVYGGATARLTFECTVKGDIDFATATTADLELANIASASGKRLNPTDPDGPDVDLDPDPSPEPGHGPEPTTPPVTPPGGDKVIPLDPDGSALAFSKAVENLTRPGEKVTKIGDKLRYTVALENKGVANSVLWDAVVSDPLPIGIEPVPGSILLQMDDGKPTSVDDAAYTKEQRTIAVSCGHLWGGQKATLTFECTVGAEAIGADNGNVALYFAKKPSEDPKHDPTDPGDEPGAPTTPPSDEEPKGSTPPAEPPTILPNDPAEGDVKIAKAAENLTSDDGKTRVGDEIRYTITLKNDGAATAWMDAVIRDDVPQGLEPMSGSIKMTLADGSSIDVSDDTYDDQTRRLLVSAGRLYGGKEIVLAFTALVTEDAVGADAGNVAVALGKLPSKWDPESTHPEPGQPFDPPSGWEAWGRDSERVVSETAYPPGANEKGGVLARTESGANDKKVDDSNTIAKKRLAQTGDETARCLAAGAALALLSACALLLARRRLRRSR